MTMVDFRGPSAAPFPHRKPVAGPSITSRTDLRPLTKIHQDTSYTTPPHTTTTTSTNTSYSPFPPRSSSHNPSSSPGSAQQPPSHTNNPMFTTRRTPSQSTTSSTTHTHTFTPSRTPSNVSSKISRTSSTRSGASVAPTSYVALMRKQKATVWCDRAQPEDPRVIAQQKAAKIRAGREISGIQGKIADGRTSTSGSMGSGSLGVRSKIRHHGVPKASGYHSANANMVGGGVPMRLSANEVGDEGTYNGSVTGSSPPGPGRILHQRTNSGQSSVRDSRFLTVDTQQGRRFSQGSTPISAQSGSGHGEGIPELEEKEKGEEAVVSAGPKSATSSERENSFGKVGEMAPPVPRKDDVLGKKKDGDLERRGSVEVRKNPFTLFIANPDVDSDSD